METKIQIQICHFWSSKSSHFQTEAKCKHSFENEFDWNEENKIIFICKASSLALFKNRGLGQLGNGLLTKKVKKKRQKLDASKTTITDLLNFFNLVYVKGACVFLLSLQLLHIRTLYVLNEC